MLSLLPLNEFIRSIRPLLQNADIEVSDLLQKKLFIVNKIRYDAVSSKQQNRN